MRVQIENMGPLNKIQMEFNGLTLIRGESNAGKSHIIKALQAATFNRFKGSHLKHGCEKIVVKMQYERDEPILSVIRYKTGSPVIKLGDSVWGKLNRNVPDEVEKYHNMGTLRVGEQKVSLNYFSQFDAPLLRSFSQAKIMEILSSSKAMDDLNIVHRGLATRREQNRGSFKTMDASISSIKENISEIKERLYRVEPVEANLKPKLESLCEIKNELFVLDRSKNLLETNVRIGNLIEVIKDRKVVLEQLISCGYEMKRFSELDSKLKDFEAGGLKIALVVRKVSLLKEINKLKNHLERYLRVQKLKQRDYSELKTLEQRISLFEKALAIKRELTNIERVIEKCKHLSRQVKYSSNLGLEIEELRIIINNNLCPLCKKPIR